MAGFDIVANVMVEGLDTLRRLVEVTKEVADKLDKAADKLADVREEAEDAAGAAKKAGDAAEDAGDKAEEAGNKTKKAGDKTKQAGKEAKRAGADLGEAASQFRAMGASGTFAGDTLERFSIITSGPLGAAIGGAIVGIAAMTAAAHGLTAAINAGIETNQEYTKQFGALKTELNKTLAIFGHVILDVINFGKVLDESSKRLKKFNEGAVKDSAGVADAIRSVLSGVLQVIKFVGNAVMGIAGAFELIGVGLGALSVAFVDTLQTLPLYASMAMTRFAKVIRDGFASALESIGLPTTVVDQVLGSEAEFKARMGELRKAGRASVAAADASKAAIKADFEAIFSRFEAFNNRIDNMIAGLRADMGKAVSVDLDRDPSGATAAPGDQLAPERIQTGLGFLPEAAIRRSLEIAELRKQNEKDFGEINALLEAYMQKANAIAAQTLRGEARARELDKISKATEELNKRLDAADEAAKDLAVGSLSQLGSSIMQTMGAFSVGASSLRDFGDAMADLAARIASDFGTLFIKLGAGFVITPGSQALGAGLIAAGLALQFISGAIGAKGSANAGGGGGRAAAASTDKTIAREVSRSLRPSGDDGPAVTNIEVVIGGRSIQPEMIGIIDDIVRQRRSRYLGRRAGI